MTALDLPAQPGSDQPIDVCDLAVLGEVADLFADVDPVPPGLVERIRFALALEGIDAEISRLRAEFLPLAAGVRGDEESHTITFDSASLTIMITISRVAGSTVRLDGWLAPPAAHRVELRTPTGRLLTDADEHGCFVLARVPRGLAQLIVRTSGDGDPATAGSVVTPSI